MRSRSLLRKVGPTMRSSIYRNPDQPAAETPALLFDMKSAARMLSVCEKTVWTLIRSGRLKCCRIGSRVLLSRTALEAFVTQQEVQQAVAECEVGQ